MAKEFLADDHSPHYPKKMGDVVLRKHSTWGMSLGEKFERVSYSADLQNASRDSIVYGPQMETEAEALEALAKAMSEFGDLIQRKAAALLEASKS